MTFPVARVGDPLSHGGEVTTGSGVFEANGRAIARVGDKAICAEHGEVTITSGSTSWEIDGGRRVARVGSVCSCGATITDGSPNVHTRT